MIAKECVEIKHDSNVACPDGSRTAIFANETREELRRIRIDGCVVTNGMRADWIVEKGNSAVVIELKGRDVEHAANQVFATAELWKNVENRCNQICALIVARRYPRASSSVQLKQQSFARRFGGPMHVVTHNPTVVFEHVMSFKGPFKL